MQDTVADYLVEASPTIVYATSGGHADATFDAPWDGWIIAKASADANLLLLGVEAEQVNLAKAQFLTGYPVNAGETVVLRITNGVAGSRVGDPAGEDCQFLPRAASISIPGASFDNGAAGAVTISGASFDNNGASAVTIPGASFDNTGASAVTITGAAFDNTAPDAVTISGAAFDNNGASPVTIPGASFDNTGAAAKVLEGEQSPVAGTQSPTSPTTVAHTDTLSAGTNYLVQVGSRAAPVTINLPDPGALGQRIEIVDTSGQAVTYPITVNGGTRDVETTGVKTYVINRTQAVLAIYYTGTYWKMF